MGFTIVDLNVAGYKNDPWILTTNVAQVFYITDPVNAKKEIVLPRKQRVAGVYNVTDPEEYNQSMMYRLLEIQKSLNK